LSGFFLIFKHGEIILTVYYLLVNFVTFAAFGIDKYKAIQRQWRIPEKTLIGMMVLGGGVGALAGMQVFRHKTRHMEFWAVAILCILVHVGVYLVVTVR